MKFVFFYACLTITIVLNFLLSPVQGFGALSPNDPSSFSRPDLAVVTHIDLNLNVLFKRRVLTGTVTLKVKAVRKISEVILDVSELSLERVRLAGSRTKLNYTVDEHIPNIGSKLTIHLDKEFLPEEKFQIKIKYTTSPYASGLQWLRKNQTLEKKNNFLFSQSSPIHARSILPCQDTPSVKFTYTARIEAPRIFTVLMSALTDSVVRGSYGNTSITSFKQPVPIPSNLMAIAVAVLESRELGSRTKVYSEAAIIDESMFEFEYTELYIRAAEKFCGPYEWTRYDILVLPPSFPYGAMENPCITYVTPTLLAGDRSQVSVISHEIAHSWTGNLVSIKNFEHFWLKEGWTVYLERKIRASLVKDPVEAKQHRDFFSLMGLEELITELQETNETDPKYELTKLVVNLTGRHPEDSYGNVPYEKGSLFIRYLEDLIGIVPFEAFIRSYIEKFKYKSHDTDEFMEYFLEYFEDKPKANNTEEVDWRAWLYTPGMPPVILKFDTTMADAVIHLVNKINDTYSNNDTITTISPDDVKRFTPHQIVYLLQKIINTQVLPIDTLESIGSAYGIATSKNSDIKYRWLRMCVQSKNLPRLQEVFQFLNSQGRTKYVRPLYRDLYAWEEVRQKAIDNFLENEHKIMHVTVHLIEKELHLV